MKATYTAQVADNGYVTVTAIDGPREVTMGFQNIEAATLWVREHQTRPQGMNYPRIPPEFLKTASELNRD